jgi:predicted acylesterase/phospholipase RssA
MLALHSLVLGGGGAKGVVYPKALRKLHDDAQIDLRAVSHVAGASAGALTGFILALGGTPYALEQLSPAISEALPFATKQYTNKGDIRIALGRLTTLAEPGPDGLDGSSVPSVLLIWAEAAMLQILTKIVDEYQMDDEGEKYLAIDGDRCYLDAAPLDPRYFWDYDAPTTGPHIAALRSALATGLRDLRRFGCYLVTTHHKIVSLLNQAGIDAGWKHLTVSVTQLYHDKVDSHALAEEFGSLNYVSSKFQEAGRFSAHGPIHKAFVRHKSTCLMAAAQASGAFPLLFQSVPLGSSPSIRDFLYTDGGCMSNMPVEAPIFVDSIDSTPVGDCNILALGLNNGDEASSLPSSMTMLAVQRLMLPSNRRMIVTPDESSFFAKAKREICKTPAAEKTKHGWLFKFSVKPSGNYRIFYISKQPNEPISLTSEIPFGRENRGVDAAIDDYAQTVSENLTRLIQQDDPPRGGLGWR